VNDARLVPPVVELGLFDYPDDPIGLMHARGVRTVSFDAARIARELGDLRLGNTVMLGAIADHLPFSAEALERCVLQRFARKGEQVIEMNRQAFAAGRAAAAEAAKTQGAAEAVPA
jgi:indolepyruvate ferredoxin oxidoreductase beta subunit